MATAALDHIRNTLDQAGARIRDTARGFSAQCPAHDDTNPSLSVTGIEGQALVYCHAGCDTTDVLAALGLSPRDLYDNPRDGARYRYDGGLIVRRSPEKRFWQEGDKTARELYRLAQVRAGVTDGMTIYVAEGEKDVHALTSLAAVATCAPGGAGKAHHVDWAPLKGADVVIVADHDKPGEAHARQVATLLDGIARTTTVMHAATGKDAADHIAAGHGLDEFIPAPLADEPDQERTPGRRILADYLYTRQQLKQIQPPEPLIEDVLDLNSVAVLVGDRSTLKTFLALDWAASVAAGRAWQGRTPTKRLRGLYMAGEGGGGIDWRLDAWETGWQEPEVDQLDTLATCPRLQSPDEVDQLVELVERGGYQFVVLDTLSKAMPGADENSAMDMSTAVSALYRVHEATAGGVVLALHHTGKDGMTTRGSSVLEDGVDTVIRTRGSREHIELESTKRKESAEGPIGDYRFREIAGTHSGVIESATPAAQAAVDEPYLALLEVFRTHFSETGASRSRIEDASELPSRTVSRHINELLKRGFLHQEGARNRPHYVLA